MPKTGAHFGGMCLWGERDLSLPKDQEHFGVTLGGMKPSGMAAPTPDPSSLILFCPVRTQTWPALRFFSTVSSHRNAAATRVCMLPERCTGGRALGGAWREGGRCKGVSISWLYPNKRMTRQAVMKYWNLKFPRYYKTYVYPKWWVFCVFSIDSLLFMKYCYVCFIHLWNGIFAVA